MSTDGWTRDGDWSAEERQIARRAVEEYRHQKLAEMLGSDQLTLYVATQNGDLTEGKGGRIERGRFLLRADAERAAYALEGVMGSENQCPVLTETAFASFDAWVEHGFGVRNAQRLAAVTSGQWQPKS